MTPKHTPLPWRIGDAGHTVFGPPNGNPSPEIVASLSNQPHRPKARANAALIVQCVNSHAELVAACETGGAMLMNLTNKLRALGNTELLTAAQAEIRKTHSALRNAAKP